MIPIDHVVFVAVALFTIGTIAALVRRSLLAITLSLQFMLVGAFLAALAFNRLFPGAHDGQMMAVAVAAVASAQLVVGLAIIAAFSRARGSRNVDDAGELRW